MKDTKKIIFIHGFGSNCDTDKKKKLDEFGYDVECVKVNHTDPDAVKATLMTLVKKHLKEDPIIVGHSLGGLWAYYLASHYGLKCCLINPSFTPSASIAKNFSKEALEKLAEIRVDAFSFRKPPECIMIGELGDEVLDHNETAKRMKDRAKIVLLKGGDHRFKHFDDLKKAVQELTESYLED